MYETDKGITRRRRNKVLGNRLKALSSPPPHHGDTINILINARSFAEQSAALLEDGDISCARDERAARMRIYALRSPSRIEIVSLSSCLRNTG